MYHVHIFEDNTVKMLIFLKLIWRFSAIPIISLPIFFEETDDSNIYMENAKDKLSNSTLKNNNKVADLHYMTSRLTIRLVQK